MHCWVSHWEVLEHSVMFHRQEVRRIKIGAVCLYPGSQHPWADLLVNFKKPCYAPLTKARLWHSSKGYSVKADCSIVCMYHADFQIPGETLLTGSNLR